MSLYKVTIPDGQTSADVNITALTGGTGNVVLTLENGTGYTIGSPSSATVILGVELPEKVTVSNLPSWNAGSCAGYWAERGEVMMWGGKLARQGPTSSYYVDPEADPPEGVNFILPGNLEAYLTSVELDYAPNLWTLEITGGSGGFEQEWACLWTGTLVGTSPLGVYTKIYGTPEGDTVTVS